MCVCPGTGVHGGVRARTGLCVCPGHGHVMVSGIRECRPCDYLFVRVFVLHSLLTQENTGSLETAQAHERGSSVADVVAASRLVPWSTPTGILYVYVCEIVV